MNYFLDEVKLRKFAPSIFADCRASWTSERYEFISTNECLLGLKEAGFLPVMASQSRTRLKDKIGYTKHMIRLRHRSLQEAGGMVPEIILTNAHDGTSSYQLRAGIYRFICANGLIIGNELFCRRVRHQGDVTQKVVASAKDLLKLVPYSLEMTNLWQLIQLNDHQKIAYSLEAPKIKWGGEIPIDPEKLLIPSRGQDEGNDVWTTFNVVQENLFKGGLRYRTSKGVKRHTRAIKSIEENVRVNTKLWALTENLACLLN
ncbi:conserved hypothetical protein (plasmid) [Candidatus Protochlamydia naegleriophila]|uniref:DUF945 domain-containing protein n=1 Tax=Candidatus Protochlamydia naegleriophila TaxID=389348 RepID=A0A0U5JGP7_9BACT|nr:DUF932 domain-containing protein [Candidatus Protochlamydia naegleriophila]CUI18058.1 conserved hypothetical protein [Candidatus Protochlamydia naegleriophila]